MDFSAVWALLLFSGIASHCATGETYGESKLVYQWTSLDFDWPSDAERAEAIRNGSFVPERNLLAGLKVYKNDVYVTVPRWRWTSGQPVTLAKVVNVGGKTKLRPYPDWSFQKQGDCQALQYIQSMEIDPNTGLMYAIDTGRVGLAGTETPVDLCPAKIVVFDLNNDLQVASYELPSNVVGRNSNFINDIVLDYVEGKVRYAYISDVFEGRLHVYDFLTRSAHNLEDHSMKPETGNATVVTINGKDYHFSVGIDGIAMSPDFKYVYYCPLGGYNLYQIPTSTLRHCKCNCHSDIRLVGKKVSQSDGMAYGNKRLYYGALGLNAVYYWDSESDMTSQNLGIDKVKLDTETQVAKDDKTMQWPDTLAFDNQGWLWFISNRLPVFNGGSMDFSQSSESNMRIWKVYVNEMGYLYQADQRTKDKDPVIG